MDTHGPQCVCRGVSVGSRRVHPWETLGGNAWPKANETERAQVAALLERYAERPNWTVPELAEFYDCREWQIRQARYLAICGGYLTKEGRGFAVTEKEVTNA